MFRILIFAVIFLITCARSQEIPSYIKPCRYSDPKLGTCIRKSIISLKPYLKGGIPALDVPPLDPLFVPFVNISQAGGVQINASFENITINGADRFRLRSVRVDTSTDKIRMKIWFPSLELRAIYELRGQLLMMPIHGRGGCYGNFSDIDGELRMKLSRFDKKGKQHFKVEFIQIDFTIGGATVDLDNLFNGDPTLSQTMNQFINENWRLVTAEIRPTLETTIASILMETADKFFDAYSISKLFLM